MTSPSTLTDGVALSLFQSIKQGMQNGRITDLDTVQTELDAAIAELNNTQRPEKPTEINDHVGKILLEIESLHEEVTKCETQLADFQLQAKVIEEDTARIVARTVACGLLVEEQQKENAKVFATMTSVPTTPHSCVAPAPSPTDSIVRPAPPRSAVISFPGGPRTVTIYPPGHASYESIIRDERGDVIIDFRRNRPLHREGAFRGPDIDWHGITRVCGRASGISGTRVVAPNSRCPDRPQPSSQLPPPSRGPSDLIARQRQLSTSVKTDLFGRVLAREHHRDPRNAKSPSLSTGMPSDSFLLLSSSQDSESSSSVKLETVSTLPSTPPSPFEGRGKKRTRSSEDDEGVPVTSEMADEEATLVTDLPNATSTRESITSMPDGSRSPEGPTKRKRLRSSVSTEGLSTDNLLALARSV